MKLDSDTFILKQFLEGFAFSYLRSTKHADGCHPVEAVPAHQVGNVILEFHFLPRESRSLKQLSSGRVVVLLKNTDDGTSAGGNGQLSKDAWLLYKFLFNIYNLPPLFCCYLHYLHIVGGFWRLLVKSE